MRDGRHCRWFVLLLALALASPAGAAAAGAWPTLEFEVFEGSGRPLELLGRDLASDIGFEHTDREHAGTMPLDPALKREMERYLSEVAAEYQRLGFPPPVLEPRVTRADGRSAYRVYWFEFSQHPQFVPHQSAVALAGYHCPGQRPNRRISFNARIIPGDPAARPVPLAESTGRVPGRLDRLTPRGYGELAHELFHMVQRGTAFFQANCEPPAWITEGTAEAIGRDMAWKLRGVRSTEAAFQIARWGVRPYHQPLATDPSRPGAIRLAQGYGTSSLWRYLAELERDARSTRDPPPKPDAGPVVDGDAFDYGYLARLLSDGRRVDGNRQALDWLDRWLQADARLRRPLDLVFPDFMTVFADYGRHRLDLALSADERQDRLLKRVFDDCEEVSIAFLGPSPPAPVALSLPAVAARCVRLERTDAEPGPLVVDVRTSLALQDAHALHLGVAGIPGASKATVAKPVTPGLEAIASWTLTLDPGQSSVLVFANVAENAGESRFIEAEVAFAVSGWMAQGPPFDPSLQPPGRPGRSPRPPRDPRSAADSIPASQGPGAATLQREPPGSGPACRWDYVDAAVHCGPTMSVTLKVLPRWLAHGGLAAEALESGARGGSIEGYVALRSADALQAIDATVVRLTLPALAFGFQGSVPHALVDVSGGGWPESVSRGPGDVEPGRLAYFPASGQVVIEEYGPLVLRGRFEASLVAKPLPQSGADAFMQLPVLGRVSGRFTVGQPWREDARYEAEPPSAAYVEAVIAGKMPGPLRGDGSRPEAGGSATSGDGQAGAAAGVASPCDCSCAGRDTVLRRLEQMDVETGDAGPAPGQMALAMCLLTCGSAYARCP